VLREKKKTISKILLIFFLFRLIIFEIEKQKKLSLLSFVVFLSKESETEQGR
jgi:hypothetical protein